MVASTQRTVIGTFARSKLTAPEPHLPSSNDKRTCVFELRGDASNTMTEATHQPAGEVTRCNSRVVHGGDDFEHVQRTRAAVTNEKSAHGPNEKELSDR